MPDCLRTEIARTPTFLEAWLWHHPAVDKDLLEVLRSPVVEATDPRIHPVNDYITGHCTREIDWATVEDEGFMFGECIRTEYSVYKSCPGDAVNHNCARERKGEPWLSTGQYRS